MRIASLILNNFALVKDSGITKIDASFSDNVQFILGSNGAGKSSVQKELSTTPSVRSLFPNKGSKEITIEKDGQYYRLVSEYEKPSSPHAFYKGDDEENLNVGRTTNAQLELIAEHLGITPLADDLIMNRITFPRWTAAKRKEFLVGANPDNIKFVLDLTKQTSSKIKACRNNLARLQSRKILLEADLIDDAKMEELTKEKTDIDAELHQFQQHLMNIELGLRSLPTAYFSPQDLDTTTKTLKRCHYQLSGLPHVSRDDHQRQKDRESYLTRLAVCDDQYQQADEQITSVSQHLAELETRYREITLDGDLGQIDGRIQELEIEREKLIVDRPPFEFSQEELNQKYQELDSLQERLQLFVKLDVKLLPTKRRQHRERMLSQAQNKQASYRMRLSDLQTQYEDLSQRHKLSPSDIPNAPCAKNACPLYSHFMGQYENTETQRRKLARAIDKGNRKTERLSRYTAGLLSYFETTRPYTDQIRWLINYAQGNPVFHKVLQGIDILSTLSTNPNSILRLTQDAYQQIDRWLKLKSVQSDLETAYALKSRQISSESHDTIKLVSNIDAAKHKLVSLRQSLLKLSRQKVGYVRHIKQIERFDQLKDTVWKIKQHHLDSLHYLADTHEKSRLKTLQRGVEEMRSIRFSRLSEIERILRSQSGLQERYQEEVLSQIGAIEQELADLIQMEKALIAIPKENMIGFINSIFEQANLLIHSVWTIPLSLELLKSDDPLDYTFQVSGDNESLRELGECSEGQNEILTLCINLALRMVLKLFNYPLCLDETGRTFDGQHQHNLVILLKRLLDDGIISQLFWISHMSSVYDSFGNSETMVLREENVVLPQIYNRHVSIS